MWLKLQSRLVRVALADPLLWEIHTTLIYFWCENHCLHNKPAKTCHPQRKEGNNQARGYTKRGPIIPVKVFCKGVPRKVSSTHDRDQLFKSDAIVIEMMPLFFSTCRVHFFGNSKFLIPCKYLWQQRKVKRINTIFSIISLDPDWRTMAKSTTWLRSVLRDMKVAEKSMMPSWRRFIRPVLLLVVGS